MKKTDYSSWRRLERVIESSGLTINSFARYVGLLRCLRRCSRFFGWLLWLLGLGFLLFFLRFLLHGFRCVPMKEMPIWELHIRS